MCLPTWKLILCILGWHPLEGDSNSFLNQSSTAKILKLVLTQFDPADTTCNQMKSEKFFDIEFRLTLIGQRNKV